MNVLFIGGSGVISSACTQLAADQGINVFLINRGQSLRRIPDKVKVLIGDINNTNEIKRLVAPYYFDAVVNWIAFEPHQIERDIEIFKSKTNQYIFISSASVYATPTSYPVTESHRIDNPYWEYSQKKIACELVLQKAFREINFPMTIVRPSHTYDETMLPISGGYTIVNRILKGKKVIIHGDGTSLWTLTYHTDFAKGFVPLLGHEKAIGEVFHITSDEWLSWNQIFDMIGEAFNKKPDVIHIPSDFINQCDATWGAGLLGDKSVSMIFDNSKIKIIAPNFQVTNPFNQGVKKIAQWYLDDTARQVVDRSRDALIDQIISKYNG